MNCSMCTKTLLSFCVYEQRLCHVFAMYVIAMRANWSDKAKNQAIYCITWTCKCAKVESYLCNVYVCVMYISCNACAETLLSFCVYEQRLCHVFIVYVIAMHVNWSDKAKNRLIYCITSVCICIKAESCLRSIYMYVVYELQHVCKNVAVLLCICELQHVNDCVVIVLLFNCVWAQHVSKALLLLCWC